MGAQTKTEDPADTDNVADIPGVASGTGIATRPKPGELGTWALWMLGRGELPTIDPSIIRDKILERMLTAETMEDVINAGVATNFDDLADVPVEVTRVYPLRSTFKDKGKDDPGVFMVVEGVRLDTGETFTATTSGGNIMALLCRAQDMGWTAVRFRAVRSDRATEDGFYPFQIRPVGEQYAHLPPASAA